MRNTTFQASLGDLFSISYDVKQKDPASAEAIREIIDDLEDIWAEMMDYEPQKDEEDIEENV